MTSDEWRVAGCAAQAGAEPVLQRRSRQRNEPEHVGDADRVAGVLAHETNRLRQLRIVAGQHVGRLPRDQRLGRKHVSRRDKGLYFQM